jgi:hypothetical protein
VKQAAVAGIPTQITVSPCLPYTPDFADMLLDSGAARIVVDNFIEGDGSQGRRTGGSPIAEQQWLDWADLKPSQALFDILKVRGTADISWSVAGFCGIRPRIPTLL